MALTWLASQAIFESRWNGKSRNNPFTLQPVEWLTNLKDLGIKSPKIVGIDFWMVTFVTRHGCRRIANAWSSFWWLHCLLILVCCLFSFFHGKIASKAFLKEETHPNFCVLVCVFANLTEEQTSADHPKMGRRSSKSDVLVYHRSTATIS